MTGIPVTRAGEALTAAGAAYIGAMGMTLWRLPHADRTEVLVLAGLAAALAMASSRTLGSTAARARLLLAAVAVGVLAAGARVALMPPVAQASASALGASFSGVVRQGPLPGGRAQLVVDTAPPAGGAAVAVLVRLRPGGAPPAVMAGDAVRVSASRVAASTGRSGPRDDGVELTATGATLEVTRADGGVGHLIDGLRVALCELVDQQLPAPAGSVFLGVVFGLRRPLPPALSTAYQATGLVHLLVLSGLKVAVLVRCLRRLCDGLRMSRPSRLLTVLPAITGYVLLGGAGPAATRSALMAAVALLFARDGRRVDALPLLAVTGIGVLTHDPRAVLTVGFQLSYAGTAGIILFADPLAARLRGPAAIREAVAATLAAQAATLPTTAATFGLVSVVGPVANAVALPLLPLVVMVGGAGVALAGVDPALGWLPLHLAGVACVALSRLAEVLGGLPGAALAVGPSAAAGLIVVPLLLGVVVARTWSRGHHRASSGGAQGAGRGRPRPRRGPAARAPAAIAAGVVALAVPWLLLAGPDGRLHVTVLDAGDGVAVLVRTPAGVTVLVDAGASAPALGSALGSALPLDAPALDALVLTGSGRRTAGGLGALVPQHPVGELLVPDLDVGSAARAALLALSDGGARSQPLPPGAAWRWGGADWRCLPVNPSLEVTPGASFALQVATPDGAVLVLGDLDPGAQDELAATAGGGLRSRLLVAPPGGALTAALLGAAAPERIVVPGVSHGTALPELAGLRVDRLGGHSRGYVLDPAAVEAA